MRSSVVRLLALSTLFAAAACDGDGTGGNRLTPVEVAGVYRVCTLRFVPDNSAFPAANLLERVVHVTPPAGKPEPTVTLSPEGAFQLSYTRRSDAFTREIVGAIEYGADAVTLRFYNDADNPNAIAAELLLPQQTAFTYQAAAPRRLTTNSARSYSVTRRDYARAAGVEEAGFAATIPGRLEASLQEGTCS
ncbi:MAG TPA: hypothetical protein VF584_19230 [Longimicrobium sp.]|jgi:hypothetical protein